LVRAIWVETRGAIVGKVIAARARAVPAETAAALADYQRWERVRDDSQHKARVSPSVETNKLFTNASREHVAACPRFNRLSARAAAMDVVPRLGQKWQIHWADISS
jgi:hypothetical protein